jgi:arylsulfatase A-like enzyme
MSIFYRLLPVVVMLLAGSPLLAAERRPNVLLIAVDDLRPELNCYGKSHVHSPNIDRLANRSLRFDRGYCQYPVCNPSRTSLLTGLRPETTQVMTNEIYFREKLPNVVTLPQLFRSSGYRTVSLGKIFHEGSKLAGHNDAERSWTEAKVFAATKTGRQGEGRDLTFPGGNRGWCRWLAAEGTDEDQPDGRIAAEALSQLNRSGDQPWFLAVGFNKPHDPFISPKKYFDLYPPEKITVPTLPADRTPELRQALGGLDFSKFTDQDRHEFMRAYLAGVSFMDAQVGKLLDGLDEKKLWDQTIVIFFGDHGYHLGEHNWWNKSTLFEHSARVPLMVSAPGTAGQGKSSTALVELVDLYPTLCDLCNLTPPSGLEGYSFKPLLREPNRTWKRAAFTVALRGKEVGRTVRTERWRYTQWDAKGEALELYDQQADSDDYHNLASDPRYADVRAELKSLLDAGWKAALPAEATPAK